MSNLLEYMGGILLEAWPLVLCAGIVSIPILSWIANRESDEYDSIHDYYDLDDINDKKDKKT